MKSTIEIIYKKHQTWVEIAQSFGCVLEDAEDVVQDMYIKMHIAIGHGLDVMYDDKEVNYYYIFRTLKSIFLDKKKKEKKRYISIDEEYFKDLPSNSNLDYNEYIDAYRECLSDLYWYDRKVYELINDGISISDLSRKTKISYYSLYNTYKKVKKQIKNQLWD